MPHVTDAQPGLPPGRYGSPRKLPRWAAALLIAGGVVALVPVAVSVVHRASPAVRATVTGYDVQGDHRVEVMLDITKPADRTATCTVRARNFYSDVVGTSELVLTGATRSQVVTKTFPTSDKAVIVEVTGCVLSPGG